MRCSSAHRHSFVKLQYNTEHMRPQLDYYSLDEGGGVHMRPQLDYYLLDEGGGVHMRPQLDYHSLDEGGGVLEVSIHQINDA